MAHEIGHCCLHARGFIDRTDSGRTLGVWDDPGEEAEANTFAGELLLPKDLFVPRVERREPCIKLLETVGEEFKTSTLATAVQYINYTNEVVALVVSQGLEIEWSKRAKEFWPKIRTGQLSKDSAAGERLVGKGVDTKEMVSTPAYAWFENFEKSERDVKESSIYLDYYGRTVTLLWWDDEDEE